MTDVMETSSALAAAVLRAHAALRALDHSGRPVLLADRERLEQALAEARAAEGAYWQAWGPEEA